VQGELKLKLPEGVKQDHEDVQSVATFAKEHKLSEAQAQALLDRSLAAEKELETGWAQQLKTWEADLKADPEIGGQKFEAAKANVQRFMARFGDKALEELLNKTGLGVHKDLFRVLSKAGEAMGEDRIDPKPKGNAASAEDQLKTMYPNSPDMWR
jgi:hypothetical protein